MPSDLSLWIQIAEAYHCNEQEDEAVDALKMCIEKASAEAGRHHASKYGDPLLLPPPSFVACFVSKNLIF